MPKNTAMRCCLTATRLAKTITINKNKKQKSDNSIDVHKLEISHY